MAQPPPGFVNPYGHNSYATNPHAFQPPAAFPTQQVAYQQVSPHNHLYIEMLKQRFDQIDTDRSGSIGSAELVAAFSTREKVFSTRIARLLIRSFSTKGEVCFAEFERLDAFVHRIRSAFVKADVSRTGHISKAEMRLALHDLGFGHLSNITCANLIRVFDVSRSDNISYECFVELSALLNLLTTLYSRYDKNPGSGTIELTFEQLISFALFIQ
ncbi:hypothetical protein GEMRC1_009273 [Eukaryota sp. GEM-RC1]